MTHLASPRGGKLKTILRWRTDNFIQTLSYFPTLLLFKQERRGDNCKLYLFIYNLHIYLDLFWPCECPPACWPQIKRLSDTQLTSVPLLSAVDILLSMCECQVSPLPCSAALLRQIICTFSVAGSPQSTLTGRPPHQAAISLNKLSQFIGQQQQSSLWRNSQWDS